MAGLRSVLVPVDGSPASMRAVEFACAIAKRNRGKVYVIYVIEVKRALALDAELAPESAQGEEILSLAEGVGKRLDCEIEGDLLQARDAGHAVVDEAVERNADLIVLGVAYRRPFGEFELGRVASHILEDARCEVVIVRQPGE